MRRLFLGIGILAALASGSAALAPAAAAQDNGLILDCENVVLNRDGSVNQEKTTRCGVNDFVAQFVRLAQWGLTIVVFLAALMLVYGGFEFITAGGRAAKISSGQNIISGTVIGLIVSLSAYVIINFSVGAVTGTKTSTNPFTAIATVFGGADIQDKALTRPFSGNDEVTPSGCRASWATNCSNQVYCADPVNQDLDGDIAQMQSELINIGCACELTGCFDARTVTCVRRFQIANNLVPSGVVDQPTATALAQPTSQTCWSNEAKISAVLNALPSPTASVSGKNRTNVGCCVVHKTVSGTPTPLYCINDISERACAALGPNYIYAVGEQCAKSIKTKDLCGFCRSVDNFCFQEAGKYWCENVVKDPDSGIPYTFQPGVCLGGGICKGGCVETLKTQ